MFESKDRENGRSERNEGKENSEKVNSGKKTVFWISLLFGAYNTLKDREAHKKPVNESDTQHSDTNDSIIDSVKQTVSTAKKYRDMYESVDPDGTFASTVTDTIKRYAKADAEKTVGDKLASASMYSVLGSILATLDDDAS